MKLGEREHFKLHPDDEGVDRIEIDVVPRFKTSGLSGDEWRISARIRAFRKGELVGDRSVGSMEAAANMMSYLWMTLPDWCKGPLYAGERGGKCQQAGCREPAEVTYRLNQEWEHGHGPLPPNSLGAPLRRFCSAHAVRGDAAFEDSDENYERVSGPPPDSANIPPEDVSPSARVDVKLGNVDEMPMAVKKLFDELGERGHG